MSLPGLSFFRITADPIVLTEFRAEQNRKTLKQGRVAALLIMMLVSVLIISDILYHGFPIGSVLVRVITIAVSLGFIIVSLTSLQKLHAVIEAFYTLFLMSIVSMMCARLLLFMGTEYFYLMINGTVLSIIFVFIFATGGFRQSLIVYGIPLAVTAAWVARNMEHDRLVYASGMNLLIISIVGIVMSEVRYRQWFREFLSGRTMKHQNRKLQDKNQDIQRELDLARNIQASLIPAEVPLLEGLKFAARYEPMREVGGDMYDFMYFREPDRIGIFICDVTGHGVPAALIAGMVKSLIISAPIDPDRPAVLLEYINSKVLGRTQDNFITACFVIFDQKNRTCRLARAGHCWPLLVRDKKVRELKSRGRILGIFPEITCEEISIPMNKGDRLLLYTDGLSETRNSEGVLFQDRDFYRFLESHFYLSLNDYLDALNDELEVFRGGKALTDDACIVGLEITS